MDIWFEDGPRLDFVVRCRGQILRCADLAARLKVDGVRRQTDEAEDRALPLAQIGDEIGRSHGRQGSQPGQARAARQVLAGIGGKRGDEPRCQTPRRNNATSPTNFRAPHTHPCHDGDNDGASPDADLLRDQPAVACKPQRSIFTRLGYRRLSLRSCYRRPCGSRAKTGQAAEYGTAVGRPAQRMWTAIHAPFRRSSPLSNHARAPR